MISQAGRWAALNAKVYWLVVLERDGKTHTVKYRYTRDGAHWYAQALRRYPHATVNSVVKVTPK